jgi:hypothetical protein
MKVIIDKRMERSRRKHQMETREQRMAAEILSALSQNPTPEIQEELALSGTGAGRGSTLSLQVTTEEVFPYQPVTRVIFCFETPDNAVYIEVTDGACGEKIELI